LARLDLAGLIAQKRGLLAVSSTPFGDRAIATVRDQRTDRRIKAREVRVVGANGEQLGVLPTDQALARAQAEGLNLVEVNPMARPPVCKIMDYGRFKYEEKKKANETKKKQVVVKVKEGIEGEKGKLIVGQIKDAKLKVQASIQDSQVRVTGKNKDDLQATIALLRGMEIDDELQFQNFRD
jgi:translation initiation factor IF-3